MRESIKKGVALAGLLLGIASVACSGGSTPAAAQTDSTPPPGQQGNENVPHQPEMKSAVDPAAAGIELRNRLADSASPYLLQHAANPVAWFPWGPEAFAAARALDRPIFLSVGYSTCYWCHVMERETFESEAVAAIMNDLFVCIKVDREERPDVDDIYMTAVQMSTGGHGGWPMSVFIEPNGLKPFFGGTYFPPDDSGGRPGFKSIMRTIATYWSDQREAVVQQADQMAAAIAEHLSAKQQPQDVSQVDVEVAVAAVLGAYDADHGGFSASPRRAPKFPVPSTLDFLIGAAWDRPAVREAVLHTLDRMAMGGMYDQVGGGFHRYSTDEQWLVPHFEKMLYDNGQLASTYATVYEREQDPYYAEIIRETLDYVLREMTAPGGAFLSAQDAEVNHREGQNYLWTGAQMHAALTGAGMGDAVDFARRVYGLDAGTNFTDPHHPEDGPTNVLYLPHRPATLAAAMNVPPARFNEQLERVNTALLAARDQRDQPITDDKILASWNGLMIAGMADGGRVLDDSRYIEAAGAAADFILTKMRTADGRLLRAWRDGPGSVEAFFEDYAMMIRGLIAMYRASQDDRYLNEAVALLELASALFHDSEGGAFFDTLADQSDLFVRTKSTYDGAVPCGNSVIVLAMLDLHELTGDAAMLDRAASTIRALSPVLKSRPTSAVLGTLALHRMARDHPDRLGLEAAAPADAAPPRRPVFAPGQVIATTLSTARLTVAEGASSAVTVTIHLADGHHVNAHEPGMEFMVPLAFGLVDGAGLELDVTYPEGHRYDGPEGAILVHHGQVSVPVTIRRTGPVTGTPRLTMTSQVCNDRVCLMPTTDVLPLTILAE